VLPPTLSLALEAKVVSILRVGVDIQLPQTPQVILVFAEQKTETRMPKLWDTYWFVEETQFLVSQYSGDALKPIYLCDSFSFCIFIAIPRFS
jgi:hypothetical protein